MNEILTEAILLTRKRRNTS